MKWLAELPSTNALVFTGILMALATTVAVIAGWKPPDGWFIFVASFAGVGTVHFSAKRMTDPKRFQAPAQGGRPEGDQ